jgi:hypothetical protein
MKIDIINDNEINIIFTISDSSSEINLPKLDGNDLLVESKNKLRKLSKKEIDKLFLNNKENIKIYIFPVNLNDQFIIKDRTFKMFNLIGNFINDNNIVDVSYLTINELDYIFSINEYSKSYKHFINETFELINKQQNINFNVLNNIKNKLIERLTKYKILEGFDLKFPEILQFDEIKINSQINIPNDFEDKIVLDTSVNINFDEINNSINTLSKRYNTLKEKIDRLHSNFLIKFSCFDAISTNELTIDQLFINGNKVLDNNFYFKNENGKYQYYLNVRLLKDAILKIVKDSYNEVEVKIESKFSIEDDFIEIDLGRLPLIKDKSHAYVLTWDAQPSDLDTHMFIFDQNFNQLDHVAYFQKVSSYDVNLDVDDTSAYGPETLTINTFHNDFYYLYSIHDFSNQGGLCMWNYNNGTKINIFENNKLYSIQPNVNKAEASWWDVFVIHNRTIYLANNIISNSVRDTSSGVSFTKENASNIITNYIKNASTIIKIEKL